MPRRQSPSDTKVDVPELCATNLGKSFPDIFGNVQVDAAGGSHVFQTDFCSCEGGNTTCLVGPLQQALESSGCRAGVFGGANNVGLMIFLSGFVKNWEDEISDFKMSHWKQGVSQNTLKFKKADTKPQQKHSQLSLSQASESLAVQTQPALPLSGLQTQPALQLSGLGKPRSMDTASSLALRPRRASQCRESSSQTSESLAVQRERPAMSL
jgi:hypothetical protein